jgi:enoyl-CoA hydratase/carnithine racemase
VLWGANGVFCAGADLKAFAEGAGVQVRPDGDGPMGPTRMLLSKPVIAAVSGHAVAGGLELAIWCDLRVAEDDAVFGVFNRRWGVPLLDGGTIRLARLIGMSRALDLVLTGRPVDAAEAERIGLANRVVPAGRARAEAEALARLIASFPPLGVRSDRRSVYETEGLPIPRRCAARQARSPATPARAAPARPLRRRRRPPRRPAHPVQVLRCARVTASGPPAGQPDRVNHGLPRSGGSTRTARPCPAVAGVAFQA